MSHLSGKSVDRINDVIDKISRDSWTRGYYCAVAVLLREEGTVTPQVRSLFNQGGAPREAAAGDLALFAEHGLI
ncbi:hypothetical protein CBP36_21095 (plasmid) [Acidovorax carolinensis]|uniref:Uncharacterized protein n=1 Tax=Acidovorax carolinensis TaxID=553814 RepID=A0A240UIZ1_9BURK|nr:hypothetical protein [Acidovorax carolinensis]ART61467.1 hypothetical protein CBP36_21095 [Acidovorax carolinensis]